MLAAYLISAVIGVLAAPAPTCAVPPAVLDAVQWAESRGRWWAVGADGAHFGAYQVGARWSATPTPALFVPYLARVEAERQLCRWQGRARGRVDLALAAYRCGNGGLRGACGTLYARSVLRRANGWR